MSSKPCKGMPHHPDQGFARPCPLRDLCRHFADWHGRPDPLDPPMQGPYDFDDEVCGQFVTRNGNGNPEENRNPGSNG